MVQLNLSTTLLVGGCNVVVKELWPFTILQTSRMKLNVTIFRCQRWGRLVGRSWTLNYRRIVWQLLKQEIHLTGTLLLIFWHRMWQPITMFDSLRCLQVRCLWREQFFHGYLYEAGVFCLFCWKYMVTFIEIFVGEVDGCIKANGFKISNTTVENWSISSTLIARRII